MECWNHSVWRDPTPSAESTISITPKARKSPPAVAFSYWARHLSTYPVSGFPVGEANTLKLRNMSAFGRGGKLAGLAVAASFIYSVRQNAALTTLPCQKMRRAVADGNVALPNEMWRRRLK